MESSNKGERNQRAGVPKLFKCQLCCKAFTQNSSLKEHWMLVHSGVKEFICDVCGRAFVLKDQMIAHKESHAGAEALRCQHCKTSFVSKAELKQHMLTHLVKRYKCQECGKDFQFNVQFKQHMIRHSSNKFPCRVCHEKFSQERSLKKHVKLMHSSIGKFSCETCGRGFFRKYYLKNHEKTHMGNKDYICRLCKRGFYHKAGLSRHMKAHREFKCEFCTKRYFRKSGLIVHMRAHMKKNPKCQPFGERCARESSLKKREVFMHTREYVCELCGLVFLARVNVICHLKSHVSFKDYRCRLCYMEIPTKEYTKLHMTTHTSPNKVKCSVCSVEFSDELELSKHMMTYTERNYRCGVCGNYFRESNFNSHMGTHCQIKEYNRFSFEDYLSAPVILQSKKEEYPCEMCGRKFFCNLKLVRHLRLHSKEKTLKQEPPDFSPIMDPLCLRDSIYDVIKEEVPFGEEESWPFIPSAVKVDQFLPIYLDAIKVENAKEGKRTSDNGTASDGDIYIKCENELVPLDKLKSKKKTISAECKISDYVVISYNMKS